MGVLWRRHIYATFYGGTCPCTKDSESRLTNSNRHSHRRYHAVAINTLELVIGGIWSGL